MIHNPTIYAERYDPISMSSFFVGNPESSTAASSVNEQGSQDLFKPRTTKKFTPIRVKHSLPLESRSAQLESLTMEDLRELEERLPLHAAAASLGISMTDLRRACRRLGIFRWRHRARAAFAAAVAEPEARAVSYAANLRRQYASPVKEG